VVPNPPAELLLEVEVAALAAVAEVLLEAPDFKSPFVAAGVSAFKIVGIV